MPDFGTIIEQKGITTRSGDASTTSFTIAHGLGVTPAWYIVAASSTDAAVGDLYFSVDATNITVNYAFPPPSGTNNLSFNWRVSV